MTTRAAALDGTQYRALLQAFLRLSVRTVTLLRGRAGGVSSLTYVVMMYGAAGLVAGATAMTHPDLFAFSVGLHSITFFVTIMAALVEANEILFDHQKQAILSPLPIHPRTRLLANASILVVFTSIPALALNLVPSFSGLLAAGARPWFPLVHIVSVVLLTAFSCAVVVCVYGLVLRLFGRERFENLAVWSQVGMIVLYVAGFQVVPRLFEGTSRAAAAGVTRWLALTPPGWFAAVDCWWAGPAVSPETRAFAALALVAPLGLGWLALTRLSTAYDQSAEQPAEVPATAAQTEHAGPGSWRSGNLLLRHWLRDPVEWAVFRLAITYIRRDRETKLRIYNLMAPFLVFCLAGIVQGRHAPPYLPLVAIAYSAGAVMAGIDAFRTSSRFSAAQIFSTVPIAGTAPLFQGVRKACILFMQVPLLIGSGLLLFFLRSDWTDWLLIASPVLVVSPTVSLLSGSGGSYLPLSRPPSPGEQYTRQSFLMMGVLGGLLALCGLAYGAKRSGLLWLLLSLETLLVVVTHVSLTRKIAERPLRPAAEG